MYPAMFPGLYIALDRRTPVNAPQESSCSLQTSHIMIALVLTLLMTFGVSLDILNVVLVSRH
jgi:hypothetical protein